MKESKHLNWKDKKSLISFIIVVSSFFLGNILYQPYDILTDANFLSSEYSFENPDMDSQPLDKKAFFVIASNFNQKPVIGAVSDELITAIFFSPCSVFDGSLIFRC